MPTAASTNSLIAALPRNQRARFLQACEPAEIMPDDVLCKVGQPYRYAYFPQNGVISQMSTLNGHKPFEMRLIGYEGMLAATVLLGVREVPMPAIVQCPGIAMRISIERLRRQLQNSPELRKVLEGYLFLKLVELSVTAACSNFHSVDQRLARLLLLTHDRTRTKSFHLTHESLAAMLGARRSSVTIAAGALKTNGFIDYFRGEITILDRPGLESVSCECYERLNERRDMLQNGSSCPLTTRH